jgi:hypothetical protein
VDLKRPLTANSSIKILSVAVLLVASVLVGTLFWFWAEVSTSSHLLSPHTADPSTTSSFWPFDVTRTGNFAVPHSSSGRPVFPYSVVPGGVTNAKELKTAMREDSVVASHYADFLMRSTHRVGLASARQVYVSYRLGDRIYWTRKKITLPAGETLLTDGIHLARTRCGNRISGVPAEPVSPSEPPAEVFDKPLVSNLPVLTVDSLPGAPIWSDTPPPFQITLTQPPQPGGGPFIPVIPIFPCCGGPGGGPSPPSNPTPSPLPLPPPPTATPEPSSVVLLVIGFGGLFCVRKFRHS